MNKMKPLVYLTAFLLSGCAPVKKNENVDHIILAINNLEKGMAQFKAATGIEPVFGGVHPDGFTHNALVALNGETYIEIMAPRPDAKDVPEDFAKLETLTPAGWAVRTRTKEKLKTSGFAVTENHPGSRAKPDGSVLKWITFRVDGHVEFPFFIQWGDSTLHPSASSPGGCRLKSLAVTNPDTQSLSQLNDLLNLGLEVAEGNGSSMVLTLNTPKGVVVFSEVVQPKK